MSVHARKWISEFVSPLLKFSPFFFVKSFIPGNSHIFTKQNSAFKIFVTHSKASFVLVLFYCLIEQKQIANIKHKTKPSLSLWLRYAKCFWTQCADQAAPVAFSLLHLFKLLTNSCSSHWAGIKRTLMCRITLNSTKSTAFLMQNAPFRVI